MTPPPTIAMSGDSVRSGIRLMLVRCQTQRECPSATSAPIASPALPPHGCISCATPCPVGTVFWRFLPETIAGGVDIVQLREKRDILREDPYERRFMLEAAGHAAGCASELGALLIVNDRPELAAEVRADGVHVGQDDMPVAEVREIVGPDMLIGLSTHTPQEIDAVDPDLVDYIGVGPVHATPTKPGRPAVGLELVRYAATHARVPFFAIGGLDAGNVGEVIAAGAARVCVLRALAKTKDPERATRAAARGAVSRRARTPRASRDAARSGRAATRPARRHRRRGPARARGDRRRAHRPRPQPPWRLAAGRGVPRLRAALLALGMYRRRYWAVLGFEALLAFQIIVTSLALVVASTMLAAGLCVLSIVLGGWLFWKLVRVMGRIQAGERE